MGKKNLRDRMKSYENNYNIRLKNNSIIILRLDGRCFRKFTRDLDKPYDIDFSNLMAETCFNLKDLIPNIKFIYSVSDEINILIVNDSNEKGKEITRWYNNRIQKIISSTASLATLSFNKNIENIFRLYLDKCSKYEGINQKIFKENYKKYQIWVNKLYSATFDCRAFKIPRTEVCNYFIFRLFDGKSNSIQSLAQQYYKQKDLDNKNLKEQLEMIKDKTNIDWNTLTDRRKYGFAIYKNNEEWILDNNIPDLTKNRDYIDKYIK